MTDRILVTSALPYANGSIHLGHLVEYIQTDIYVRFLKHTGRDAIYLCADDTHGTPIEVNARKAGISPEEFVAGFHREHLQDFSDFHIEFDRFYSTHSEENRKYAEEIYGALEKGGHIETRSVEQLYCEEDGRFLPDRFIRGTCPNPKCGAEDQYGDVCEECSTTYSPTDLKEPHCGICGKPPVLRSSVHYFFRLDHYEEKVREWVNSSGALQEDVRRFVTTWLDEGLKDWDISRDGPYFGFKIPGEEDKYFYVWLDAPVGYIATTDKYCQESGRDFDEYWRKPGSRIIHFIGKDIVYFHTLFWPAMLMGSGFQLPERVVVHGFLTVDGTKMSKSRGTFINARTFLDHLDPQYLRYYYAAKLTGASEDLDLSFTDFTNRVNAELINKIANLVSRVAPFVNKHFEGRLGSLPKEDGGLAEEIRSRIPAIREAYESLAFHRAVQDICAVADLANKYFQDAAPWAKLKEEREEAQAICTLAANCCRSVAALLKPILPRYAADVEKLLQIPELTFDDALEFDLVDHAIGPFERLVERVDPKSIEKIVEASKQAVEQTAGQEEADAREPLEPEITYDDFAKLDFRVAEVVSAEVVPKADKLLKLVVDLGGGDTRSLFAGIRRSYPDPQVLVGRRLVVVANLKPRKMRFGVSEAMLLAAGPSDKELSLAQCEPPAIPGHRVR